MAERILFITGKLAESALRRQLAVLARQVGFEYDVAVMPITVAALLTTPWIAKRLQMPDGADRIVLPGLCKGDVAALRTITAVPVQLGPYGEERVPVLSGIAPNDWVLAAGVHLVREGQRVEPVDRDNRPIPLDTSVRDASVSTRR